MCTRDSPGDIPNLLKPKVTVRKDNLKMAWYCGARGTPKENSQTEWATDRVDAEISTRSSKASPIFIFTCISYHKRIHQRLDVLLAHIIPRAEVCRSGPYLKLWASCSQNQSPQNLLGDFWTHVPGFCSLKQRQRRLFGGEPVNSCF